MPELNPFPEMDSRMTEDPCGCIWDTLYGKCMEPCIEHEGDYWWQEEGDWPEDPMEDAPDGWPDKR